MLKFRVIKTYVSRSSDNFEALLNEDVYKTNAYLMILPKVSDAGGRGDIRNDKMIVIEWSEDFLRRDVWLTSLIHGG